MLCRYKLGSHLGVTSPCTSGWGAEHAANTHRSVDSCRQSACDHCPAVLSACSSAAYMHGVRQLRMWCGSRHHPLPADALARTQAAVCLSGEAGAAGCHPPGRKPALEQPGADGPGPGQRPGSSARTPTPVQHTRCPQFQGMAVLAPPAGWDTCGSIQLPAVAGQHSPSRAISLHQPAR